MKPLVDCAFVIVRLENFAYDDLTGPAEFKRDLAAALEGRGRLRNPR